MNLKVFLSYARKDGTDHVLNLHLRLTEQGIETWYDQRNIDPTQDFSTEIEKGIKSVDSVVICLTPDVERADSFVRREIAYAQMKKKPIYVAKFDANVDPPITIATNTYFEFFQDWQNAFDRLFSNLQKLLPSGQPSHALPPASEAPVQSVSQEAPAEVVLPSASVPMSGEETVVTPDELAEDPAPIHAASLEIEVSPLPPQIANKLPRRRSGAKLTAQNTAATYHAYHEKLYEVVVDFLDQALITQIDLSGRDTPEAVHNGGQSIHRGLDSASEMDAEAPLQFRDIDQAFEHYHRRMLLLGEPGSGKTVTLMAFARNAIARRLTDPNAPIVLLGFIQTWNPERNPSITQWLCESHPELDPRQVQRDIDDGKALLLLDGLDELGQEHLRGRLYRLGAGMRKAGDEIFRAGVDVTVAGILGDKAKREADEEPDLETLAAAQEIIERYDPRPLFVERLQEVPRSQVLLTCRIRDYHDIGTKVSLNGAVTLQPLSDAQLTAYLSEQPDLLIALELDDALRDMLRRPLLLSLFAYAYQDRGEDAERLRHFQGSPGDLRDEIINTYVRKRYDWEANREDSPIPYTLAQLYDALGRLAMYAAADSKTTNILRLPDLKILMGDDALLLIDWCEEMSLLVRVEAETWRFIHMLVRDHFAFNYAIKYLAQGEVFTGWSFAEEGSLANWETWLKKTPYSETLATRALGEIGDARAVQPLLAELGKGKKDALRQGAAVALGKIGDSRAIQPLIVLFSDPDIRTRRAATEALKQFGELGFEAVVKALKTGSPLVREQAIIYLTDWNDPRSDSLLIETLKDTESKVRTRAIHSLGQRHTVAAVEAILELLDDPNPLVKAVTARVLGELGDPRSLEGLVHLLQFPDPPVVVAPVTDQGLARSNAQLQAVGSFLTSASKTLLDAYADQEAIPEADAANPAVVRQNSARSLGRLRDERAIGPLTEALRDRVSAVRKQAASALDGLGWKPTNDEETAVYTIAQQRWSAVVALGGVAVVTLIWCLDDG
ncbi:MAG: HEAT repeat domain-containing protein, partial [Anaerolineae bacterium]|nr:HEAT repeat domain-containing protein [Anaerolineae bacterium]